VQIIDTLPRSKYDTVVKLGNLVKTQGKYDEDGNEITPPIRSNNYKVDVLWHFGEQPQEWQPYEITEPINNVKHRFS